MQSNNTKVFFVIVMAFLLALPSKMSSSATPPASTLDTLYQSLNIKLLNLSRAANNQLDNTPYYDLMPDLGGDHLDDIATLLTGFYPTPLPVCLPADEQNGLCFAPTQTEIDTINATNKANEISTLTNAVTLVYNASQGNMTALAEVQRLIVSNGIITEAHRSTPMGYNAVDVITTGKQHLFYRQDGHFDISLTHNTKLGLTRLAAGHPPVDLQDGMPNYPHIKWKDLDSSTPLPQRNYEAWVVQGGGKIPPYDNEGTYARYTIPDIYNEALSPIPPRHATGTYTGYAVPYPTYKDADGKTQRYALDINNFFPDLLIEIKDDGTPRFQEEKKHTHQYNNWVWTTPPIVYEVDQWGNTVLDGMGDPVPVVPQPSPYWAEVLDGSNNPVILETTKYTHQYPLYTIKSTNFPVDMDNATTPSLNPIRSGINFASKKVKTKPDDVNFGTALFDEWENSSLEIKNPDPQADHSIHNQLPFYDVQDITRPLSFILAGYATLLNPVGNMGLLNIKNVLAGDVNSKLVLAEALGGIAQANSFLGSLAYALTSYLDTDGFITYKEKLNLAEVAEARDVIQSALDGNADAQTKILDFIQNQAASGALDGPATQFVQSLAFGFPASAIPNMEVLNQCQNDMQNSGVANIAFCKNQVVFDTGCQHIPVCVNELAAEIAAQNAAHVEEVPNISTEKKQNDKALKMGALAVVGMGVMSFKTSLCGTQAVAPLTGSFVTGPTTCTETKNNPSSVSVKPDMFATDPEGLATREGGDRVVQYLNEWWVKKFKPALQKFSTALQNSRLSDSSALGLRLDGQTIAKTARKLDALKLESRDRNAPSQLACITGSYPRALSESRRLGQALSKGLKNDIIKRSSHAPGTDTADGEEIHQKKRWEKYCADFHDPDNNNGVSTCPNPTTAGTVKNGDINVEKFLFQDTIDFTDEKNRKASFALLANLIQPRVTHKLPESAINTPKGREWLLRQQHLEAARSIAAEVITSIMSRRVAVNGSSSGINPDDGKPFLRAIRLKAGVKESAISDNPSYNEIMLGLTKERFFDPQYYIRIQEDLAAIKQEQASVNSYITLQYQDIYKLQEQINALLATRAALKYNSTIKKVPQTAVPINETP